MLDNGDYLSIPKNPLPGYIRSTKEVINSCKILIPKDTQYKLIISNPTLPRLYCLPKIHKTGGIPMRPIVSINSPTYLISKWLVAQFSSLYNNHGSSVKNNVQFTDSLKHTQIQNNEIMVSFDVVSLFPSIPIDIALNILKGWLTSLDISADKTSEYLNLTHLCMKQNAFTFKEKFYVLSHGTAMGNPLSPFLANIFMDHFEKSAKEKFTYFPRIWFRYVDDIFAIFDKSENLDNFLSQLNSMYTSINFTVEIEKSNEIPFLDLKVIRNSDGNIEFDIYRKITHTDRYIFHDSHHTPTHKRAAFNSLVHRLINIPLTEERYKRELRYIHEIAKFNGYSPSLVNHILNKANAKKQFSLKTTLKVESPTSNKKWIPLTYYPPLSNKISKIFQNAGFQPTVSTKNTLKNLLGNTKDPVPPEDQSGIYQIKCSTCPSHYIGQTKRKIGTRFKEHISHFRFNRPEKSSVAAHILDTEHPVLPSDLKLLKSVKNSRELDAWESRFIFKFNNNILNQDSGMIPNSALLKFNKKEKRGKPHAINSNAPATSL